MENYESYKKLVKVEKRRELAETMMKQNPDKIPIIFEPDQRSKKSDMEKPITVKLVASRSHNIGRIKQVMNDKLGFKPDQTMFIFKDGKSIQPGSIL